MIGYFRLEETPLSLVVETGENTLVVYHIVSSSVAAILQVSSIGWSLISVCATCSTVIITIIFGNSPFNFAGKSVNDDTRQNHFYEFNLSYECKHVIMTKSILILSTIYYYYYDYIHDNIYKCVNLYMSGMLLYYSSLLFMQNQFIIGFKLEVT